MNLSTTKYLTINIYVDYLKTIKSRDSSKFLIVVIENTSIKSPIK